jgi:hypothetical protein
MDLDAAIARLKTLADPGSTAGMARVGISSVAVENDTQE